VIVYRYTLLLKEAPEQTQSVDTCTMYVSTNCGDRVAEVTDR